MFLKSLEIRGFKSFADKTQLKFKRGVTAVVGPNGSGKSNISDSVRWVLGEQSVKTLRGGKMEDVIFAGTQFRKPVGLAQVSITLDNTDDSLDTDYSEVTVTRRIFRSGETEYLINNQKCRLKDINNLFMDTGIGKEGYSLIGQGKIEAILSGKPEERRALLEEAAGIVKFKYRKEEAERKLANTENNLVRIRDIIATYEERIGPLKLEREKAIEYKDLAESLKIKEVSLLVHHINKIEEEFVNLTKEINIREEKVNAKRAKLEFDKEALKSLESKIEELALKNEAEKREYYSNKELISQSVNDIGILKERISNLREVIEKDKKELNSLENSLHIMRKDKKRSEEELEQKLNEQMVKSQELKELEYKITTLNKDIVKIEKDLSDLKNIEFEALREVSEIKNSIAIINKDILNEQEQEVYKQNKINNIQGNIRINIATAKELNKNIDKIKYEKVVLENDISENKKKIGTLSGGLNKKDLELKSILKDINTLDGKLMTLKDLEKSYEGYQMSVKRLMERVENGKLSKTTGAKVLGEIFKVDKIYETAIEISLGGAISNIITNDEMAAKYLIEYLKKNNLGRATFLPLNIIKGNRVVLDKKIESIDGFLGIASDLIKYDNIYKNIMDYSLGKTIIASNMNAALEISKLGRHKLRVVTLDGEVISPGGALTGGSIYKKNNSSILGRRREVKEFEVAITENKDKYRLLQNIIVQIKEEIKAIDEENLNKSDEIHSRVIDITRLQGEVKSLENEHVKLKKSLEIVEKELTQSRNFLEKLQEEIKIKQTKLENFNLNQESTKKSTTEKEDNLTNKKILFEKLKDSFTELKVLKATLDETLQGKRFDLQRKEREELVIVGKLKVIKDDLVIKDESIIAIESDTVKKSKLIDELNKRSLELEEVFKQDEIEKISLKDNLKVKQGLLNELIDIIRVEENEFNKMKITHAKSESERDINYKKLNEELGLTLAEAMEIALDIESVSKIKDEIFKLKNKIVSLGTVNLAAIVEYQEVCEKYEFMSRQEDDLNKSKGELLDVIKEMTSKMQVLFIENFKVLNKNFDETFKELFKGGNAELILSEGDELTANIDINVQPPGKKLQNINLMSGGEKVLSAIALLFAILKMKPTPFCILDEIEAALDDANVYRYAEFLKQFSENIQFIVITHRKGTMEASDIMYGVTMEEKGISKVVSVDLSKND